MNVGGILTALAVVTGVIYFFFNYRGRYGRSQIGIVGAFVVAVVLICLVGLWNWAT